MSWDGVNETLCPTARALSVVGERWTLLILRELSFGVHRFDEIQAQTKMSPNLLARRLKRLETDGLVERRSYSQRPPRYEYHRTAKGEGMDTVLLALRAWGMQWESAPRLKPATVLTLRRTGEVLGQQWMPGPKDMPFSFDKVTTKMSPAFSAERKARHEAFLMKRAAKD